MRISAALCYVSRHIREDWSIRIVTGISKGQEYLNGVLLITFWEHLNEKLPAHNAVCCELSYQNFIVITCQTICVNTCIFIPGHEPAVSKITLEQDIITILELILPVCK